MGDIEGTIHLTGGVVAGQPTVQAVLDGDVLFSVTADTEEEAFAKARRRLTNAMQDTSTPLELNQSGTRLSDLPPIHRWSETSARRLLDTLLASEGHPNRASAFSLGTKPHPDGESEKHWLTGRPKGNGTPGPRQRAYLAFYWTVCGSGQGFWGRGLNVGDRTLRPDKGIIRECLYGGLLKLDGGKFLLTPKGERVVLEVLGNAPWADIAGEAPEAAPLATCFGGVNG